jgi:xanthine dehydrogenase YagS FAD-binding subunit
MQPFEYASPTTKEQAAKLLAVAGSAPLAGGSDLLALLKDGIETPKRLVNLKAIPELSGIRLEAEAGVRIGAAVTLSEIAADPVVRRELPELAEVAGHAAGPQIRNVATLGGNLCQRPRCWYFRNGYGLLAQKDGKSMVTEGANRYHAILGSGGPARFVHPSTVAPLLVALGAQVVVFGPNGGRLLDLARLYREPQEAGEREHALEPGEYLFGVNVPPLAGKKAASYEVRQRESLDWSLATAAVVLDLDGGKVRSSRIVLGQVAPTPWLVPEVQAYLRGKAITPETASKAGELAVAGARPLSENLYKVQLTKVAVKRALLQAAGISQAAETQGGA